jgi:uncharacterized delta-60 repeat protein
VAVAACTAAAIGVTALTLGGQPAGAWPGDPDGSFGSCGNKPVDITQDQTGEATSVVLDDGRYLVGGSVGTRALVAKFTAAGALDPAFGTGGKRSFSVGDDATVTALALQSDDKVVGAGTRTADGSVDSLVARLTPDGALDPTFNGSGRVVMNLGASDRLTSVQVQTNNAILVGATVGSSGAVARLTPTGDPDTTFDGDGRRTGIDMTVQAMVLQPDGKIVIGGRAGNDFALMRLKADGSTDSSFGGATGVRADLGGYDYVTGLALDVDGKVVAVGAGHGAAGSSHTIVRRYNTDGTRDTDFHNVDRAYGLDDEAVGVVVRGDGKIVVAGNSTVANDNDVLVLRLESDGLRDQSFGIGGVSLSDAGSRPIAGDLVVRSDGRVIVVGSLHTGGARQLALLRFQGDAATAPRPAQGYVVDGYGSPLGFSAGCAAKPPRPTGSPHWAGWDIVRGIAVLPGGRGLVVDGFGGLHGFRFGDGSMAGLQISGNATWANQDMARGVAVVPEGTGGFVVDRTGHLHPFKLGSGSKPKIPSGVPSWPGQDFARGVALLPNGAGGYVLDAAGGLHPFGGAPAAGAGVPSWPGQDVARGVTVAPDGSGGWVVDAYGGMHAFGIGGNTKPPTAVGGPYWAGVKIARGVAALL